MIKNVRDFMEQKLGDNFKHRILLKHVETDHRQKIVVYLFVSEGTHAIWPMRKLHAK